MLVEDGGGELSCAYGYVARVMSVSKPPVGIGWACCHYIGFGEL